MDTRIDKIDGAQTLAVLAEVVPELARALGPDHEIVVHDLRRIPDSIIAIGGTITGRSVGGSITDLLLRAVRQGRTDSVFRYRARTKDGRTLSSSTVFIHDLRGEAIGCLCVNRDITDLLEVGVLSERMRTVVEIVGISGDAAESGAHGVGSVDGEETFVPTVDELALLLANQAIERVGVPVELMQKQHKAQVIHELEVAGLFLLRDAVDFVAGMLHVSRETIYNYLKEVREESADGSGADQRRVATRRRLTVCDAEGSEGE